MWHVRVAGVSVELREVHYRDATTPPGRGDLHEVTLSIGPGESVAAVGPDHAGGALLRVIGGVARPASGTVAVGDVRVTELSRRGAARFRRGVGFLVRDDHLLGHLSALDNVMLALMPCRSVADAREQASAALADAGVPAPGSASVDEWSGLDRRRVTLARAIVAGPRLLLVDEPTAGLDARAGDAVLDLLADLHHRRGMTLVMATANTSVAAICGRIVSLRDGRVAGDRVVHDPRPDETLRRATGFG